MHSAWLFCYYGIMKKILISMMCILMAGCSAPAAADDEKGNDSDTMTAPGQLHIEYDNAYGGHALRWQSPDNGRTYTYTAELLAEDAQYQPQYPVKISLSGNYLDILPLVGWDVQENEYVGNLYFRITAEENSGSTVQEDSPVFASADIIPSRKELHFGEDIAPEDIQSFAWSGSGDTAEASFSYGITGYDGEYGYSAHYHDAGGREHNIERRITADEWQAVIDEVCLGNMHIRYFDDPEMFRLDGSDESFSLLWKNEDVSVQNLYEYIPAGKDRIIEMLKDLAQ